MDKKITMDTSAGKVASSSTTQAASKNIVGEGLTNIKQGDQITGTVTAVGEQVTIDFNGQQVTASKEVLKNVAPGEVKTFDVVKVSKTEIELKLQDGTAINTRQIIKAALVTDKDWETVLSRKEQTAKVVEKDQRTKELMGKLQEISTSFTENDCSILEQEGFPVETMTVQGLYEAIARVKNEPEKNNTDRNENSAQLTQESISARLKDENLPATTKNLNEIKKALTLSETVGDMDDKAMRYLIDRDMEPTIENIYKANYSGSRDGTVQKQELTETAWQELLPQVKSIIQDSGYEVNDENLQDAKWLIENKLPLTKQTFTYKKELEELKSTVDPDMVLDRIAAGMKKGILPKDVSLATQDEETLRKMLAGIQSISPEAVTYAVNEGMELTIKKLAAVQADISSGKLNPAENSSDSIPDRQVHNNKEKAANIRNDGNPADRQQELSTISDRMQPEETVKAETKELPEIPEENTEEKLAGSISTEETDLQDNHSGQEEADSDNQKQYEAVRAQRQMEEIRLKMTLEAASRLEKKGFSIETQKLERVVEELRRLEDNYYRKLLSEAEVPAEPIALETLKNTSQSLEQLRYIPAGVLGATLTECGTQTIPALLTEGLRLQSEYAKAGTAYETLMTVPNAEYGDSIRKAFAHADSLLRELNLEDTEANQRAVRILGYNQMEITPEAVEQVKGYDSEVTALINNLHPAVTVRMIKEGVNPLNMTITELNDRIDAMKKEQGISAEEKFSTYLHRLEKEEGINPEERKAYIGIYRLLYNVEKSDGAALGAVIKADREVTLNNLLTAVQTSRKGRMNAVIDDEFGTLSSMTRNKESMAEQLSGFRTETAQGPAQGMEIGKENQSEEQTRYQERLLKQITEELSPDKLNRLTKEASQTTAADSSVLSEEGGRAGLDQKLWNTIKDMPVEKLLQQLQQTESDGTKADTIHTQKVQQLRELCQNAEQSIRFLNDFQMSTTPQNITLANYILTNGTSPITKLLKRQNENKGENLTDSIKELAELSDTINDKSSMNEAYESLEEKARAMLETACSEETLDSRRLAELKNTASQMSFLRSMAAKEFYQIPVETSRGVTNINLTILRGSKTGGKVSAVIYSEQLGEIRAEFSLKQQTLKGFISCGSRSTIEKLQANTGEIENAAKENDLILKQMDFGIWHKENDNYSYQNPEIGQQEASATRQSERMLYRVAKAIVQTVRLAEDNEAADSRAVS